MDTTTFRILDTISSCLGDSLSINQLTDKIREVYGTAHYANIYGKLRELKEDGLLSVSPLGRSSIVKLNFQNYLLIDFLTEMEIKRKLDFLTERKDFVIFLDEMERLLENMCEIKSVSSMSLARNIKLNKIELLFLLRTPKEESKYHDEIAGIYAALERLQKRHNVRIDSLLLDEVDFFDLIKSDEINPLKEALSNETSLFCPQAFWSEIREIAQQIEIKTSRTETKPRDISDLDLVYNLGRFGYKEFGSTLEQGKKFCIEYLITALLLQNDARRTEAAPIVLAKNEFKCNLLGFLSQKLGTSGKLLGLLRALKNIKPTGEFEETIKLLETLNVNEIEADERSILQKMRLYNAT